MSFTEQFFVGVIAGATILCMATIAQSLLKALALLLIT